MANGGWGRVTNIYVPNFWVKVQFNVSVWFKTMLRFRVTKLVPGLDNGHNVQGLGYPAKFDPESDRDL